MRKQKLTVSILLVLTLLMAMLAGCANNEGTPEEKTVEQEGKTADETNTGEEKPAEPVTITHWTYFDGVQYEVDKFMEDNPDIIIDLQIFGGDEYETKIRTALSSGGAPDTFDLEEGYVGKYIDSDKMVPLADVGLGSVMDNAFPYIQGMCTDASGVVKGVSNNIAPVVYWYNREAARTWLGTDDPDEISAMLASWEDIYTLSAKVKADSNGEAALWPNIGEVMKLMGMNMPPFVDADDNFSIDDEWNGVIEVLRTLYDQDLTSGLGSWSGEWASAWNDGSLIIRVMPSWDFFTSEENYANGNVGVAQPLYGAFEGATIRFISSESKEQEAAKTWLEYNMSKEFQTAYLNDKNQIPSNTEVLNELLDGYSSEKFGGQNILKTYSETASEIPKTVYTMYTRPLINAFNTVARDGVKNGFSDEEIMENFKAKVKDMFPELNGL